MVAFKDPMDSQQTTMDSLGEKGTTQWGYILGSIFVVFGWLPYFRGLSVVSPVTWTPRSTIYVGHGLFDHLAYLLNLSIFVALLFGAFMLLNAMHERPKPGRNVLFSTSFAFLPLAIFSFFLFVLSFLSSDFLRENGKAVGYFGVILLCFSLGGFFLLTFATISNILGYSRQKAFWFTPVVIGATFLLLGWCTKLTSKIG